MEFPQLRCAEFGCSDENEESFKNLLSYSPLHNIKMPRDENFQYPAILVSVGDADMQVHFRFLSNFKSFDLKNLIHYLLQFYVMSHDFLVNVFLSY